MPRARATVPSGRCRRDCCGTCRTGPIAFTLAGPRARPGIPAAVASRDAVRKAQWRPESAKGASLVRLGPGEGEPDGTLTWVVALKTRRPLCNESCDKPANYVVAFIRARDGRFLGDAAGYSPQLAGRPGTGGWGMAELAGPPPHR